MVSLTTSRLISFHSFDPPEVHQGGHGTGKTGNLDVNFSRQGKQGIWLI